MVFLTAVLSLAPLTAYANDNSGTNTAPRLKSVGSKSIDEGETVQFKIHASDSKRDSLTISAPNLPENASLDDRGGGKARLDFAPDFAQAGMHTIMVVASDGSLADTTDVLVLVNNVNQPPRMVVTPSDTIREGETRTFVIDARDPDGDTVRVTARDLPECADAHVDPFGLGQLTLTPDYQQAGVYTFTLSVTDGDLSDTRQSTITVLNVNRAPLLSALDDRQIDEAQSLRLPLAASDPDGDPIRLSASSLPSNATVQDNGDGTGLLEFRPNYDQAGEYTIAVIAFDGEVSDTESVVITVSNVNRAPGLSHVGPTTVDEGQTMSMDIIAGDPDGDIPSLVVQGLPRNAVYEERWNGRGTVTFQPDFEQAGKYSMTLTASDGELTNTQVMYLTVMNVNRPPTITPLASQQLREGRPLYIPIEVIDPDGDRIRLKTGDLPSNAAFDDHGDGRGELTFNPSYRQAGEYEVTVSATDATLEDVQTITLSVADVDPVVAMLPFVDFSEDPDAADVFRPRIEQFLKQTSLVFVDSAALRQVLRRHRVRAIGSLGPVGAHALINELDIDYVLTGSHDIFISNAEVPEIGVSLRLTDVHTLHVVWAHSTGAAGTDFKTLFGVGGVTAVDKLVDEVIPDATEGMVEAALSRVASYAKTKPCVAVVRFDDLQPEAPGSGVVTAQMVSHLIDRGYPVVDPGAVQELCFAYQDFPRGEISLELLSALHDSLGIELVVTGAVDELQLSSIGLEGSFPTITLSGRVINTRTAQIAVATTVSKDGDRQSFLGLGGIRAAAALAKSATATLLDKLHLKEDARVAIR